MLDDFERIRVSLGKSTEDVPLMDIALAAAKTIARERSLSSEIRSELLSVAREWGAYVETHQISTDDLFSVRWHIQRFAQERFRGKEGQDLTLLSESVDTLTLPSGQSFQDFAQEAAGGDLVHASDSAAFGGIARIALKLVAAEKASFDSASTERLLAPELPLNDVDIVMNKSALTGEAQFNADLAGTRIVADIKTDMSSLLKDIDCTLNQSLIHEGKLYYTQEALDDAREGIVRFTDKEDALFGAEVDILPDGKKYINRRGFYRGLSYLLRGKATSMPLYADNLRTEAPKIGRYWIVILAAKILTMKDGVRREEAIGRWFNLAHTLKVTNTHSPRAFLEELLVRHPEMKNRLLGKNDDQGMRIEQEIRWLGDKLVSRSLDTVNKQSAPLSGMSEEMVTIDESFFSEKRDDVHELIDFVIDLQTKDASS